MKKFFSIIYLLTVSLHLLAVPAREGLYTMRQPDGSTFQAYLKGDEFRRVMTTPDGCAIVMDSEGYYRYASFDALGRRHPGPYRADRTAPASVVTASRNIPYDLITRNAASKSSVRKKGIKISPGVKSGQTIRALVILAEFPDLAFRNSRNRVNAMLNEEGYNFNNATGCASEYFNDQFRGIAEFTFDVSEVVCLGHGYAYYGENDSDGTDKRACELVAEACRLADSHIDFSQYDNDGDGEVDNVYVLVAGRDEAHGAGDEYIWSHSWSLKSGAGISLSLDGKVIDGYAISTELGVNSNGQYIFTGIGTFCHEYCHAIGLSDYYDTDYNDSGGQSDAFWGNISIMDKGCYNNDSNTPPFFGAVERNQLGIGDEFQLSLGKQDLPPVYETGSYGRYDGDTEGEFYLFEYRDGKGWDSYIGGQGMLIYHIDRSARKAGWSDKKYMELTALDRWFYNEVNCRPDHQCADLVEANPRATSINQVFWPYGSYNEFRAGGAQPFVFWNGSVPEIALTGIYLDADGAHFNVTGPLSLGKVEAFQDAAIIQWSCSVKDAVCTLEWEGDGKKGSVNVTSYDNGNYSYTLEGLNQKTRYNISISSPEADTVSGYFNTMSYYSDGFPFIYMGTVSTNQSGNILSGSPLPLRVFNCQDANDITWTLDGNAISCSPDGFYHLDKGGTLKATIKYKDGSTEVITKKLIVR